MIYSESSIYSDSSDIYKSSKLSAGTITNILKCEKFIPDPLKAKNKDKNAVKILTFVIR